MSSKEWWKDTAIHMWRTYFTFINDGFDWDKLTNPEKRIYALCNHLYVQEFTSVDQGILKMYFSSRWGDDQYEVKEYSKQTGIPVHVIWIVVRRAQRRIMEACGFLEQKENNE